MKTLKKIRQGMGITQEFLAALLGVSQGTISYAEGSSRSMEYCLEHLKELADCYWAENRKILDVRKIEYIYRRRE